MDMPPASKCRSCRTQRAVARSPLNQVEAAMTKHGDLAVEAEFAKIGLLFAGATRPGQEQPLQVSLSVQNHGAQAIPFTFNTTQDFEIELIDQTGQVIARWSDGQM